MTLSSATEHDTEWCTADLVPPKSLLVLPPRDDVAEFDDSEHLQDYKDDSRCVQLVGKGDGMFFLV